MQRTRERARSILDTQMLKHRDPDTEFLGQRCCARVVLKDPHTSAPKARRILGEVLATDPETKMLARSYRILIRFSNPDAEIFMQISG